MATAAFQPEPALRVCLRQAHFKPETQLPAADVIPSPVPITVFWTDLSFPVQTQNVKPRPIHLLLSKPATLDLLQCLFQLLGYIIGHPRIYWHKKLLILTISVARECGQGSADTAGLPCTGPGASAGKM